STLALFSETAPEVRIPVLDSTDVFVFNDFIHEPDHWIDVQVLRFLKITALARKQRSPTDWGFTADLDCPLRTLVSLSNLRRGRPRRSPGEDEGDDDG